ncbi:MAG: hypothetical protein CVV05_19020 [Gammaproteobacteria bacterium HGW-Gammaproteobacteria-1]|nr:MAG: hypothetical protein CVV05_19020 [Gammaproteobacteria bacterium HGW-Gammaproteobacteria-1]
MLMESQPRPAEPAPGPGDWAGRLHMDALLASAREFLRWWRGTLLAMVPPRLRHLIAEPHLRAEASAREVCIYQADQKTLLDRVLLLGPTRPADTAEGAAHSRCDVILDRALLLETALTLPLEAERNLRRVLAFSMDRYTPFDADDVYFTFRVTGRDVVNRKIDVMLYAAPRTAVDPVIGRLAQIGLDTVIVDVATAAETPGDRMGINLLPAIAAGGTVKARLNTALAAGAGLLLVLVLAVPLWHRHQALAALEEEVTNLLPQVRSAEQLQAETGDRLEQIRQIHQRKYATPPVLDVLQQLSRLVPDEAWAGQVEIRDGRVRLSGEAAAASEMVQTLTTSGYFADPKFEAPLTQNPRNGRERFVISLAVKGESRAD